MNYRSAFIFLILILLLKSIFVGLLIYSGWIGLGPDEAQYWTWSKELALGYYSKPPGIAWLIKLGAHLFGGTELGVRSGAILLGIFLALAVFALARASALQPRTALWAGIAMALSPLGILSSFLAITDGGMVLCWTIAAIFIANALTRDQIPNYYLFGVAIFVGALFKWPIYSFWLLVFGGCYFYPKWRDKTLFAGIAFSALGLIPSVIWNSRHDWATFRHVFFTVEGNSGGTINPGGNFWSFLGEQTALISPIYFILIILAIVALIRHKKEIPRAVQFCGWSFAAILGFYVCISLFKKMQGNWCDFAYPLGIVAMSWCAVEKLSQGTKWLLGGTFLNIILCAALFFIPKIQADGQWLQWHLPYKINPFKHNAGGQNLSKVLEEAGYDPKKHVLVADKYQTSSLLSFYSPGQKLAHFLNLHGVRKNQFSYWPGMSKGASGYFVAIENIPEFSKEAQQQYQHMLNNYFDKVVVQGSKPIFFNDGQPVKSALVFYVEGYNGSLPPETHLY